MAGPIANKISEEVSTKVREKLYYDEESPTGLRWKDDGKVAGCLPAKAKYSEVNLEGNRIKSHRCIWFLTKGDWPSGVIDHIDGNASNNSVGNLRDVSHSDNQHNHKGARGFHWNSQTGKWKACITVDGNKVYLGLFDSILDARAAYLAAKKVYHVNSPIN